MLKSKESIAVTFAEYFLKPQDYFRHDPGKFFAVNANRLTYQKLVFFSNCEKFAKNADY